MISTENKLKVAELLERNEKINAIKLVMETEKIKLLAAKELVEAIEREFFPDRKRFDFKVSTGKLVGWIFTGIGATGLAFFILMFYNDRKYSESAASIQGIVTDFNYGSKGSAAPIVTYSHNGKTQIIQGSTWSKPPVYEIGEKVEILVPRDSSGKVIINTFSERYFLIVFLAGFGVIFGVMGILFIIFLKN